HQPRQVIVSTAVIDHDLVSVVSDSEPRLDNMHMREAYTYQIAGQAEYMAESFADLAVALVFSIFLVYAVRAVQFENFLFPFIILFSLPMTAVGVLLSLFVTGLPLAIPGPIGIIMLAGIVRVSSLALADYIII